MVPGRIMLGATAADGSLAHAATILRDAGHEVVHVGGRQSAEQLVRTALAEDATEIVVAADAEQLAEIDRLRIRLGAEDVLLTPVDAIADVPRSPR